MNRQQACVLPGTARKAAENKSFTPMYIRAVTTTIVVVTVFVMR